VRVYVCTCVCVGCVCVSGCMCACVWSIMAGLGKALSAVICICDHLIVFGASPGVFGVFVACMGFV
jgi:hypothetical protein